MMTNEIEMLKQHVVDGRHYNQGPYTGANGSFSRTTLAMLLIGENTAHSFGQLKTHKARKNFWRAIEFLRGNTKEFVHIA